MPKFIVTVVRTSTEYYAVKANTLEDAEDLCADDLNATNPLVVEEDAYVASAVPTDKKEIREYIRSGDNMYTYIGLADKGSDLSEVYLDIR